jgi:hypothetical protein
MSHTQNKRPTDYKTPGMNPIDGHGLRQYNICTSKEKCSCREPTLIENTKGRKKPSRS